MTQPFWAEDITVLFRNPRLVPHSGMTEAELLNTMTWIVIVITILLFFTGIGSWIIFLILGILLILILYYINRKYQKPETGSFYNGSVYTNSPHYSEISLREHYRCPRRDKSLKVERDIASELYFKGVSLYGIPLADKKSAIRKRDSFSKTNIYKPLINFSNKIIN